MNISHPYIFYDNQLKGALRVDISIIIPIYNMEKYLKYCIDSIIKQDFNGTYEIICINDGSTDGSAKILETYKTTGAPIIILNQQNKGQGAARNAGLYISKGKYIMFLDSDDYLKHDKVLLRLYKESEDNNLDFVVADFEYDFDDKNKNYQSKSCNTIKNKVMHGMKVATICIKKRVCNTVVWDKLYKKEFLLKNELCFTEGVVYEDVEFAIKSYFLADRVKLIDEIILMYRQRKGSTINTENLNWKKRIRDRFIIGDQLRDFNESFNSDEIARVELYLYIPIIRKIKYINDRTEKKELKQELKSRKVVSRFIMSNSIRYKIFGLLYWARVL